MRNEQIQNDYTPTQALFLSRLEHLLSLRGRVAGMRHILWVTKLVPWAIHSTFLDCRDLGIEEEAQHLLRSFGEKSGRIG